MYVYLTDVRCIFDAKWMTESINETGLSNELNDLSVVKKNYTYKALLFIFQRVKEKIYIYR